MVNLRGADGQSGAEYSKFNRAETRISKNAMPELREAMALYLVEHIDELENQDKT